MNLRIKTTVFTQSRPYNNCHRTNIYHTYYIVYRIKHNHAITVTKIINTIINNFLNSFPHTIVHQLLIFTRKNHCQTFSTIVYFIDKLLKLSSVVVSCRLVIEKDNQLFSESYLEECFYDDSDTDSDNEEKGFVIVWAMALTS